MKMDLIIPSHRNEQGLQRLLHSLTQADLSSVQTVIVVFNPPEPKLAKHLETQFSLGLPLQFLHLESIGVNRARNAGVQASRAPLLFFADDDEEVKEPDLFGQHRAKHLAHPGMMLVGGSYELAKGAGFWSRVYHSIQKDWFETGFLMNGCHYQLLGGHLSAKKELFLKYQFEEKIRFGGSETELLKRLQEAGVPCCGDARFKILHHSQMSLTQLLRKAFLQGKGHSAYQFSDLSPIPRQVGIDQFAKAPLSLPVRLGRILYRFFFNLGRMPELPAPAAQSKIAVKTRAACYQLFLFFEFLSDRHFEKSSNNSSDSVEKNTPRSKVY